MTPTAAENKEARRSYIESEYNSQRDAIEQEYTKDKNELEREYQAAIKLNDEEKRDAFLAEGLNADGSDPQGRPQGHRRPTE